VRARGAFTLIELVTVIALLGVLGAAVAGATLSQIDLIRARAAAARVAGDLRYMQRYALASGLRTWVTFNVGANQYQLYAENPASPGKAGRLPATHPMDQSSGPVQLGAGPYLNTSLSSVNINSTTEVEFDSFGVPYDGGGTALAGNGVISLSGGVTVTIRPVSGFVEKAG
jgi:prepilin-type N-terminal cleavage/methylation domain-containing protein